MGWSGQNDSRWWAGWPIVLIVLAFALTSRSWSMSWFIWMIVFWFVVPKVVRFFQSEGMGGAACDPTMKHKRDYRDVIVVDKPKREPHYAIGDDGELVELYDEDFSPTRSKPKRSHASAEDDFNYL